MKIKRVGTRQPKTRFSQLLAQVEKGQRFQITRHGMPIAELGPTASPKKGKRTLGFAPGLTTYMAPDFDAPLEDFPEYM